MHNVSTIVRGKRQGMNTMNVRSQKNELKQAVIEAIQDERAVHKIIIFGSFLSSETPGDLDVAVLGNFPHGYLATALRLRKKIRHLTRILPIDIVPIQEDTPMNTFLQEIQHGEVIYERRDPTMA